MMLHRDADGTSALTRFLAHQLELQTSTSFHCDFDSEGHCPNFQPAMHGGHAMLQQQHLKDDIYFIIPPLLIILSYIYYATTWRLF
jgi:homoserine kinase